VVWGGNGESVFHNEAALIACIVATHTSLSASPALVSDGDTITITMVLTASQDVNNISPTTPIVVNAQGGASCTGITGVDVGPKNISAGGSAEFTWTCTASAGPVVPGSVTFAASASGTDARGAPATFQPATSNSVLIAPPLTFQVTVSDSPLGDRVDNRAYLNDSNVFTAPLASNAVTTTVQGGKIGDRVWWDINGDGDQDEGEPGIPGVTMVLSDSVTLTTTTTADGAYNFVGLSPDTYTVTVSSAEFGSGGTLENWSATEPDPPITSTALTANQVITTADFGFDITSSYVITKEASAPGPFVPGQPISFTITIENTGDTYLATLPMTDTYDTGALTYGFGGQFASPASDNNINDGQIEWTDVLSTAVGGPGPLAPDGTATVVVYFTAFGATPSTENTAGVYDGRGDPDGEGPLGALDPLDPKQSSDTVEIAVPTGVILADFGADVEGRNVHLHWQTANEVEMLGFNLLRRQRADGGEDFEAINPEFIFAEYSGSDQGADYAYLDENLEIGTYDYRVEIVYLDDRREPDGLARAFIGWKIHLPIVVRASAQ
jgi:hypothetical protein